MGNFNLIEIISIIFIHFFSDFIMQDEKWALGKSKNWRDLLNHTLTYTICWIPFLYFVKYYYNIEGINYLGLFLPITFIAHTATDYFTSKIVSKKFEKETPFDIKLNYSMFKTGDILESSTKQRSKTGENYNGNNFSIILMSESGYHGGVEKYKAKRYNSIPNFGAFSLVGLDQVLHYIQLFGTYYLLVKI